MAYIIKIKNDDVSPHTWVGKAFAATEEYTLLTSEHSTWGADDDLIAAITAGNALVSDGTSYFTSTAAAIAHLQGNTPSDVKLSESANISGVKDPKGMRARLVGIINETVTKNSTEDIDWLCPQLQYNAVNKSSYFDGIQYYAENAEVGDKATFQVIDKDGVGVTFGWYTQAQFDAMGSLYVVEEFGTNWYMVPNVMEDLMLYKAQIIPGLYLRMKYTSVGTTNDVKLVVNLFRHMDAN